MRNSTARLRTLQAPVVEALLAHVDGAKTRGWREAVIAAFQEPEDDEGELRAAVMALSLIPDAYAIRIQERELHFFEVEVTSPMSREKLQSYAVFLTIMDFYEVEFALFTVNQHGHINQVDLLPHYVAWVKEQQGKQA